MQLFSAKTIGLYALAIVSAIGLFHLVTSYGEANIIAPPNIAGNYQLNAANLPQCLRDKQLSIELQQSGIYLNASLITVGKEQPVKARPTLSGRFHVGKSARNENLDLVGTVPPTICPQSQLKLVGSIAKHTADRSEGVHKLQGRLWLTNPQQPTTMPIPFTATQQVETRVQNTAH